MRILIVERNTKVLKEVRLHLERRGHTVIPARTHGEGIRVGHVDLIVGEIEAIRVTRALRSDGRRIPLIVLTDNPADAHRENDKRGHKKVAHRIISKPFTLIDLVQGSKSTGIEL